MRVTTLYVDRKDIELRVSAGSLEFYEPAGKRGSVPLNQIERVVLRGSVRLSTAVLGALTEAGAGVLALSGRHSRHLATCVGRPHNDAVRRIGQFATYLDPGAKASWSLNIVAAKIESQQRLLQRALRQRPDKRRPLMRSLGQIEGVLDSVRLLSEPTTDSLRGKEGAAAAAYFNGLRNLFAPSLNFNGRNRRPPRDPVNACLSLGYTLLHFEAVTNCHAAGLDPLLGLYHEPAHGRNSLASDIMEPLRAHIDEWVWGLFRTRVFDTRSFSQDGDAVLLGKDARQRFYTRFNPLGTALRRLLRVQVRSAVRHFDKRGREVQALAKAGGVVRA